MNSDEITCCCLNVGGRPFIIYATLLRFITSCPKVMEKDYSMHLFSPGWISVIHFYRATPNKWLNSQQLVQNIAAQLLTTTRKEITLVQYWLRPVKFRVDFKILLTYEAVHGLAPSYLSELISTYHQNRVLRSQNVGLCVVSKSSRGTRAFRYQAQVLWNNSQSGSRRQTLSQCSKLDLKPSFWKVL